MRHAFYILDEHDNPMPTDALTWARWFEKHERHVALTEIRGILISTVFLGVDHGWGDGPPVLWESMIFGGKFDEEQERYTTLEDAKRGHDALVGKVTRDHLPRVPYRDVY